MKSRMVEVREGELLGPIDWSYDFFQHFGGYCCSEEVKHEICDRRLEVLRKVEADPTYWTVNTGGFWHPLLSVGMYDGWPFWKPTPALLIMGPMGTEWQFFYDLQDAEPMSQGEK